jgi:hypothetical protein
MHPCHQGLNANLFDFFPDHVACGILIAGSVLVNVVQDGGKRPLVSHILPVFIFILNESICVFVDGIIRQVHTKVVQVAAHWRLVLLCRESCQALLVDEGAKGIETGDQDVDSQVKLQLVDEIRFVKVSLCHIVFSLHYPVVAMSCQKDTFALALGFRLYDKSLGPLIIELFSETF